MKISKIRHIALYTKSLERERLHCGDCTACCQAFNRIALTNEELEINKYLTDGEGHLKRTADGCIYMRNYGCSIYDERPKACKDFDCRNLMAWGITNDDLQNAGQPQPKEFFKIETKEDTYHEAIIQNLAATTEASDTAQDKFCRVIEQYYREAKSNLTWEASTDYWHVLDFTKWIDDFTTWGTDENTTN